MIGWRRLIRMLLVKLYGRKVLCRELAEPGRAGFRDRLGRTLEALTHLRGHAVRRRLLDHWVKRLPTSCESKAIGVPPRDTLQLLEAIGTSPIRRKGRRTQDFQPYAI